MREQRHRDSSRGSPSWRRGYERDPGITENGVISASYVSSTPTWSELNCSRPVAAREVPMSGRDVRSFYACESQNPESGEYRQNGRFSGLNGINDPVHPQRSLFGMNGSIPRGGECIGQGRKMSMPGFSESVLGIRQKSASRKFQWDTLLADNDNPAIVNPTRISYGGSGDSRAVPVSMALENNGGGSSIGSYNRRMEAYENGRDYGVIDGRYAPLRRKSSIVDSIVDKVEGHKNVDIDIDNENAFRFNMLNKKRRMLLENERDVDYSSLNVNPAENQYLMENFSVQREDLKVSVYPNVERIQTLCEEYDSYGNSWQQVIPLEEALQLRLEQKRIDNEKLLELRLERNRIDDQIFSLSNVGNTSPDSTSGGHRDWTAEEQLAMFEDSREAIYQGTSTGSAFDGMSIDGNSFSSTDGLSIPKHSSKSKPLDRDLRQRLGPVLSVKQRLEFPQLVGKRQTTLKSKKKIPWIRQDLEQNVNISVREVRYEDTRRKKFVKTEPKKSAKIEVEEYAKTEPEEYSKLELEENTKTEPSEDSEEFKNQVQKSFLKLFKTLNENSADLRIYLEQRGAGRLKCCVCGSSSKQYVDALGLAQHAFFSHKSRSEHLGLFRAICVLVGWNSSISVKGRWAPQILPSAEASALREDLIIWPPVVIIHNISLANDNKAKHMTVSIEGLKRILRGMGCDLKLANIFHGKAAYQSSMVVSFSGTYSGFREAEKLHKLFREKQRGRAEFQKFLLNGHRTNCEETRKPNHPDTQNVLAGDKTNHQEAQNALVNQKICSQDIENTIVGDKTNHQEAQSSLVDEKMDSQDIQNTMAADKTNQKEAQNVLVDEKMDAQGIQNAVAGDKMNHEAQNALVDEKTDAQGIQNAMLGDKTNHLESQKALIDETMDTRDIQNAMVGEETNHQEVPNLLVDEKMETQDTQNVLACDNMNHQDDQNAVVDEKMDTQGIQNTKAGDKTNGQEAQNALVDEKMDTRDIQNTMEGDKLNREAQSALVDEKMDSQDTQNVLTGEKTNHQDAQNAVVDEKMDALDIQNNMAGDKTKHEEDQKELIEEKMDFQNAMAGDKEAQNALVDEKMDAQDIQCDKTSCQEAEIALVDEKMDIRNALAGDKTSHQKAHNVLLDEEMDARDIQVDKTNRQEAQNAVGDEKMDNQDIQNTMAGDKMNHQEGQSALKDEKLDTQDMVGDETNRQEAHNVLVCNKTDLEETQNILVDTKTDHQVAQMDAQDIQNATEGDKPNHQEAQSALVDEKMDPDETNQQDTPNALAFTKTNLEETQNIAADTTKTKKQQETPKVVVDDMESLLYGYMGIASDFDALNANTKKRSVVRSRRETEAAAYASIQTQ